MTRDQRPNGELTVKSGGGWQAPEDNSPLADKRGSISASPVSKQLGSEPATQTLLSEYYHRTRSGIFHSVRDRESRSLLATQSGSGGC